MRLRHVLFAVLLFAGSSLCQGEDCLTFTSAQDLLAKSGTQGGKYLIEIPSALKPEVEGKLKTTISADSQNLTFVFAIPPRGIVRTESGPNRLKVCVGESPADTVLTRPEPAAHPNPQGTKTSPSGDGAVPAPSQPEPSTDLPSATISNSTAGGAGSSGADHPVDFANVDLSAPESPAFTVLGLTPETVVRPNTPQELASTVISGFDQNGNFQTGFAIDTAPYLLLAGNSITLADYNASPAIRMLSRFQMSFATTKGATESDKAVRMALGFRATLWDRGDPRTDPELLACFAEHLVVGFPIPPGEPSPEMKERIEKREQELESEAERCREASGKRNWNASSWIIAGAPAWVSPTGATKDLGFDGGGAGRRLPTVLNAFPDLRITRSLSFMRAIGMARPFRTQTTRECSSDRTALRWAAGLGLDRQLSTATLRVPISATSRTVRRRTNTAGTPLAQNVGSLQISGLGLVLVSILAGELAEATRRSSAT